MTDRKLLPGTESNTENVEFCMTAGTYMPDYYVTFQIMNDTI